MRLILFILLILPTNIYAQTFADQVKSLQADARVKAAFDYIDNDRDGILREWIAITEINAPSKQEQEDIDYGLEIAREIARLDLGQTIVVRGKACVAIEAMEGTDETIKRAGRLVNGRLTEASCRPICSFTAGPECAS